MCGWVDLVRRSAGATAPAVLLIGLLPGALGRHGPPSHPEHGAVLRSSRGPPQAFPDSADLLAEVRRAQRRLERLRTRHMRTTLLGAGRCDEIVGRFCLWHEPDEEWQAPPEEPGFTEAREGFVARLAEAAAELPGDPWVAGQRVRYLQEAGRHREALGAARDCRASAPGWCEALVGFALHGAGRYERADSAFGRALGAMPAEERCRWTDLEHLLDRRARKAYRKLPCGQRSRFEARFWWLADPLYLVPGNERRTEHLWRRVMDRLQEDAASGYRMGWGDDLRELLIRYGWPAGWERARSAPGSLAGAGASTVAHDPPGSRHFVPAGEWIDDPAAIGRDEWTLEPRRPRSHYAPGYAREFGAMTVELARFRRGDTAVVVAVVPPAEARDEADAADRGRGGVEGSGGCRDREVGLFLGAGPGARFASVRSRSRGGEAVSLTVALPAADREAVASVESRCPAKRRAGRARFGIRLPAAEPAMSDLLLGRSGDGSGEGSGPPTSRAPDLPTGLAEAAARARPPGPLWPGERVPLYWEVYGARGTEATSVSVELARRGGGVFRDLFGWTGLVGDRSALVGLRWTDRRPAPGVWTRAVALQVPEEAPPGRYELRVTVRLDEGIPLRASRVVRVEEAGREP